MNKDVKGSLAWGVGIVALALVATALRSYGYIGQETVLRIVLGVTGLMIVWFGNRIPKNVVPSHKARQAQRVAGWSMVLSGLVYAGMFALAPIQTAVFAGVGAVALGMAITLVYCWRLRSSINAP